MNNIIVILTSLQVAFFTKNLISFRPLNMINNVVGNGEALYCMSIVIFHQNSITEQPLLELLYNYNIFDTLTLA